MYLERLLQINMATLAALGALLLGMGQRSVGPPLVVMLAAPAAVWLTDVTGRIQIGRWTANALMIVGAVFSLRDLYPPQSEMQTIGLSWFLIYLQIILLFQKKDEGKYWLLVMLSLLQVVVATLFSQGIGFGVLLTIYMLLGFSAMTLLMLYRQRQAFVNGTEEIVGANPRQWMAFFRQFPPSPLPRPSHEENGIGSRWPLLSQQAEFTGTASGSGHAGLGRDLVRRMARMGLNTMALTAVLFFAVPRFNQVTRRGPITPPQTLVGFNDEVMLGELGKVIESREAVMRVQFLDDNAVSRPLNGDVYLQGAYLMAYKKGQWKVGTPSCEVGSVLLQREWPLPSSGLVRQKIKIDGLDRDELFFVAPYIPLNKDYADPNITVNLALQRLERIEHRASQFFEYTLATTAIVGREQSPLVPAAGNDLPKKDTTEKDKKELTTDIPSDDLPGLVKLARQWIDEAKQLGRDRLGQAQYLEHMLSSGQFEYSLTPVERNPHIDPIEDFVTEHRQGHCEYFATALTLMLRSQGIPARMVCGFKCDRDDWNSGGGYYQVRQLHAHTWVEIHLWPSEFPAKWKHGNDYWVHHQSKPKTEEESTLYYSERCWESGGWLRLDPTPAGAGVKQKTWFTPVRNGFDWLEGVWSTYVVDLDWQTQRDAIYRPIADAARNVWKRATSARQWQMMFDSVAVALYLDHLGREAKWALLAVVGIVAMALLAGLGVLLVRIGRRLWARSTGNPIRRRGRRGVEIAFYRRFERLMARQGLVRAPAQTQHEFAAAVGSHLAALAGERRLALLPAAIADAFYRVRFGRTPLDNLQTQAVEQALVEIAAIRKDSPIVGGDSSRRL
jgi:hypothetical protein